MTQAKEQNYRDQHLVNQFLPLTVEVFGCLYNHVDVFLHNCANAIWILKGLKALPSFFVLVTFFWQKLSITLQRLQTSSILSWVVAIGLTTFQLSLLQHTSPISMADLSQATDFDMTKYDHPTISVRFLTWIDFNN